MREITGGLLTLGATITPTPTQTCHQLLDYSETVGGFRVWDNFEIWDRMGGNMDLGYGIGWEKTWIKDMG